MVKKRKKRVEHESVTNLKKTRERFDFLKEKRVPLFCYCPVAKATRMRFIRNIFFIIFLIQTHVLWAGVRFAHLFNFLLNSHVVIRFVFFLRKSIKNGESTWSRPHARPPVFVKRFLARMFQISCRKSRGIGLRTSHHRLYIYAKMFHNVMGREALQ